MNTTTSFFFTADEHYGQASIIKYCDRPFVSVEEMDSEIIKRLNEFVGSVGFYGAQIQNINLIGYGHGGPHVLVDKKYGTVFGTSHKTIIFIWTDPANHDQS